MTTATFQRALPRSSFNLKPTGIALTLIALGATYLAATVTWRQGALFLVGAAAGVTLYHAAFGFTSSWRAVIREGRGDGLRAQMLMLAVTCTIFLPMLARGEIFGVPVRGAVAPVGISVEMPTGATAPRTGTPKISPRANIGRKIVQVTANMSIWARRPSPLPSRITARHEDVKPN